MHCNCYIILLEENILCHCFFQLFYHHYYIVKSKNKQSSNSLKRSFKIRLSLSRFFDSIFVLYSIQKTGFLNPSFSCFDSSTLSLVDRVTIGTYTSVSVNFKCCISNSRYYAIFCPVYFKMDFTIY